MGIELRQRRFMRGKRRFLLGEDARITATYQTAFNSHEYGIDLDELSGKVVRVRNAKYSNLIGAALFLLLGLGAAVAMHGDGMLNRLWMVPPIVASPAVLLGLAYWRSIDDLIILKRHDGSNAIVLFAGLPDKASVDRFVEHVLTSAGERSGALHAARDSVRRLFDLGVLSADEARALSDRIRAPLRPVKS